MDAPAHADAPAPDPIYSPVSLGSDAGKAGEDNMHDSFSITHSYRTDQVWSSGIRGVLAAGRR